MRLTSSLALSGLLAASLVPAMAQTVAPAQSNSAPIVTTSPGTSNGTSTTGINTDGSGTAAGTTAAPAQAPATTSATMGGGAGNGPGSSTGTSPGTGTAATGTVITPSMSGTALSNAGSPATNPANGNPAVDTTGAKAMTQPAKGANSFTEGQAKSRLAGNGFTDISTLTKDADGVWRGRATKGGKTGDVWLDYRGNYGQP